MTKEKKERITVIVQNLKQMDIVSLKLMENNSELLRARDAFKDTKGKDIKNADEWKKVYEVINRLKLKVSSLAGVHSYSQWLQEEMIKRGN